MLQILHKDLHFTNSVLQTDLYNYRSSHATGYLKYLTSYLEFVYIPLFA